MDKIKCTCGYEGQPVKSPSMAGALLFGALYAIYYYWIKGRYCPSCGHSYTKEELAALSYNDPDKTYKILVLVPYVLILIIILFAGS